MVAVAASDVLLTSLFAPWIREDDEAIGFGFSPQLGQLPVTTGKAGQELRLVTIADGGSTAPGSLLWALGLGGHIKFMTSVTSPYTSQINPPAGTVIDARGQRHVVTGKGYEPQAARIVIANTYFRSIIGQNQRGLDIRGPTVSGWFPNLRFNGNIADQGINAGAIGTAGLHLSFGHPWFMQTTGGGFNAGANFGSSGEGSASAANNNDRMYVTLVHMYANCGLRQPKIVGGYLHHLCPYSHFTGSDGIGVRDDVQGHPGRLHLDHPTFSSSVTGTNRFNALYHQGGQGRSSIPNWNSTTQTGEVTKRGTIQSLAVPITPQNSGQVPNPASFYSYSPHYAVKSLDPDAHHTWIQRRSGDRLRVTVGGNLSGAQGGDIVGRHFDFQFWDTADIRALTAGDKAQLIEEEIVLPLEGGGYVLGTDLFTTGDVSQPDPLTIRATVSQDAAIPAPISDGYFWGGDGYVSGDSDDITTGLLSWNPITLNAGTGGGGEIIPAPPPKAFNYRTRFPALRGMGLRQPVARLDECDLAERLAA